MGILQWISHIGMQLQPEMQWIWMRKHSCVVDVEVLGVKNLPVERMERFLLSVCVRDKVTGEFYTKPSRVSNGSADFKETFSFKCHIPGTKDYVKYGGPPSIDVSLVAINPGVTLGLAAQLGSAINEKIEKLDVDYTNVSLHFAPGNFPEGGVLNLKLHYKVTLTYRGIFEWLFKLIPSPFSVTAFSKQGVSSLEETNQGDASKKIVLKDMIAEEASNHRAHIEVGMYFAWTHAKEFPHYDDVTIWGQLKPITRLDVQYEESDLVLKMDEHCIGLVLDKPNLENPNKKGKEDYGIYIKKTETEYSKHVSKYPGVSLRNTSMTFNVYINWKKVPKNKSVEVRHGDYISLLTPPLGKLAIGFVFRHVGSWHKEGLLDPLKELREELTELKREMSEIRRAKTSSTGSEPQLV